MMVGARPEILEKCISCGEIMLLLLHEDFFIFNCFSFCNFVIFNKANKCYDGACGPLNAPVENQLIYELRFDLIYIDLLARYKCSLLTMPIARADSVTPPIRPAPPIFGASSPPPPHGLPGLFLRRCIVVTSY